MVPQAARFQRHWLGILRSAGSPDAGFARTCRSLRQGLLHTSGNQRALGRTRVLPKRLARKRLRLLQTPSLSNVFRRSKASRPEPAPLQSVVAHDVFWEEPRKTRHFLSTRKPWVSLNACPDQSPFLYCTRTKSPNCLINHPRRTRRKKEKKRATEMGKRGLGKQGSPLSGQGNEAAHAEHSSRYKNRSSINYLTNRSWNPYACINYEWDRAWHKRLLSREKRNIAKKKRV